MNTQASKPATTLKPGTQLVRSFLVERSAINEETRTAELAFASETPYERWWGVEVLDCTATPTQPPSGGFYISNQRSQTWQQ